MGLTQTLTSLLLALCNYHSLISQTSKIALKSINHECTHKRGQAASSSTGSQGQLRISNLFVWE